MIVTRGRRTAERLAPRLVGRAVEDQHAVQVVELVLEHARGQTLELEADRIAVLVARFDRERELPLHGNRDPLQGQTAFVVGLQLPGAARHHGVHQRVRLFLAGLQDEHALEHADLVGCEADAVRILHQRRHPLDQPGELAVEALDLVRLHAQHGSPYCRIWASATCLRA